MIGAQITELGGVTGITQGLAVSGGLVPAVGVAVIGALVVLAGGEASKGWLGCACWAGWWIRAGVGFGLMLGVGLLLVVAVLPFVVLGAVLDLFAEPVVVYEG